jgi:hypothetical protein
MGGDEHLREAGGARVPEPPGDLAWPLAEVEQLSGDVHP